MAAYLSSWLIGSIAGMPTQAITIDGIPLAPSGDDYYLYDATSGMSLTTAMLGLMVTAGVAAAGCNLQRNGYIRLNSAGVFTVSWGVSTVMRDLLGFTGNLAGSSSYTAPLRSPLLWMPGKPETPVGHRLGVVGHRVPTIYQAVSPYSGKAESVSHGSRIYARYLWPMVDSDLVVASGDPGGTFARLFDEVAVQSARWKLYREVTEDLSSTTTVTLDQPLGPYVFSNARNGPTWQYDPSKGFERTDKRADIEVRCHSVEEYA